MMLITALITLASVLVFCVVIEVALHVTGSGLIRIRFDKLN